MNRIASVVIIILLLNKSYGQDTLPRFSLTERGNKVIISWINPFETVNQLNVQRSFDSLTNFRTIYSAPSPQLPQNGFTDMKMPTNRVFYRIFYVFQGGTYFFTKSVRLGSDYKRDWSSNTNNVNGGASGFVTIRIRDSVYRKISAAIFRSFRDSVLQNTHDTLSAINDSLVVIFPYTGTDFFKPSIYIFSSKDGISISLPNAGSRRYSVKFFDENGSPLFSIMHVKETPLILDKSNFFHSGWFWFELYEDEKLKEKNRFFLARDF